MAENEDRSQKTEQPTAKRLSEAREKGQLASSRDVGTALIFATAAAFAATTGPGSLQDLAAALTPFLAAPHRMAVDASLMLGLTEAASALALPALALLIAPILAAVVQNAVVWTTESLSPKAERISPMAGLNRIFGVKALLEGLKSCLKMTLLALVAIWALWPERLPMAHAIELGAGPMAAYLGDLIGQLLLVAAVTMAAVAVLDFAHQRFAFIQQLRMTRREVLDEHKQNEGDPIIRQRLRALREGKARLRMMANVPKATVVITNPTHFAVALRYVPGETVAPEVMAKGVDATALKIRELARAHRIPLVESPPLARALFATCEVGELVPTKHYQAVAEIIGYVMRLAEERRA